jgi:hypothetical protein
VERLRNLDLGGIIFGLVILGVGLYYFLERTLGLSVPDLNWDKIWPLLVIGLGVAILFSAWARKGKDSSGPKAP